VSGALVRLLSLLLCLVAGAAPAQEPDGGLAPPFQLKVRVTPEKVKLGEPATLEILISAEPGQRYELKTPSDLGDFDYLGQERSRVDGADQSTTTIQVRLSAFQLGLLDTPNLELEVSSANGTATLPVPRTKLEVVSTLPADAATKGANLYDVKEPEEVPIRSWRLVYVLLGILAALGLGYLLVKYLQRPKIVAPINVPPPEPLHTRVTKALDALAAENLPGKGEFKPYYFRLSEIVRGYLGELYGFEALESTTPELLNALRARTTPGLPMNELVSFAESSDFVRYAKTEPDVDQCKADLELAYRIVHSTQAAVVPPRPAAT
jgi:hypothetical protein